MSYPIDAVRAAFPALKRHEQGRAVAYLDGPGGTQVAQPVIDAMSQYLTIGNSNLGGPFAASKEADAITEAARSAMADLFNAQPEEIAFGQNMTSLTFAASRALASTWGPGAEVVVTRLDHDANVSPWRLAARDAGATLRVVDFDPADGRLDMESLHRVLNPSTRLVAVTAASNALGTVTPIKEIARAAHSVGALVWVDAVHFTPHRLVDVREMGCDFLVASSYKFFGPHTGVMFGRAELLEELTPYKLVPAPDSGPGRWESGTQSFESLAGVTAAVNHIASLGSGDGRRRRIVSAMEAVKKHEHALSERFLAGVAEMPSLRLYGITDPISVEERTPTFAVSVSGSSPVEVATTLGDAGIYVWHGHYYAVGVMDHLGLSDSGGLVRIGFVQYSTEAEVDRVLEELDRLGT